LHLSTTTVREALNFSALLRQPAKVPRKEKLEYVDEVIKLLDMQEYADAVVGVPGEGWLDYPNNEKILTSRRSERRAAKTSHDRSRASCQAGTIAFLGRTYLWS
jgi:hypothetical protein